MKLVCTALLFDLDGVLVDSRECVESTWRRWATEHGLDPQIVLDAAHGRRTIDTLRVIALHLSAEAEAAALEASEAVTTDGVYEIAGARELLESLPTNRWAIVTSGTRSVATLRIQHTQLPMPGVLVCADEIPRGKPAPDGFLIAAERLGVAPDECVVVEDTPPGLISARAAGMRAIAVVGTYPDTELTIADAVVSQLIKLRVSATANGARLSVEAVADPR